MNRKLELIGTGPGALELLTEDARNSIEKADTVIAFGRISESVSEIRDDIVTVKKVDEVKEILKENSEGRIAILASGDPCYFGINGYLIRNGIVPDRVISGISSLQYMMSRLKRNSDDIISKSFHGREPDFSEFRKGGSYFILTDRKNSADFISASLKEKGFTGKITIGANLSYYDEYIEEKDIGEKFGEYSLSVAVVDLDVD